MRIVLTYKGPENEQGSSFGYVTRVNVETDEEAEIAGQKFARLCDAIGNGAVQWQAAAWDDPSSD